MNKQMSQLERINIEMDVIAQRTNERSEQYAEIGRQLKELEQERIADSKRLKELRAELAAMG